MGKCLFHFLYVSYFKLRCSQRDHRDVTNVSTYYGVCDHLNQANHIK